MPYIVVARMTSRQYELKFSSPLTLKKMREAEPKKPSVKPKILSPLDFCLKKIMPMRKVMQGVSAFKIPLMELFIFICASENKKAGIPIPKKALETTYFSLPLGICLKCRTANGKTTNIAELSRNEATIMGGKAIKLFFTKINELPQAKVRNRNDSQIVRFF